MRRILAAAATALMLVAVLPARSQAAALTDIDGHWARTQIEAGVSSGYVSGYPDGTFRPNAPITRAEFFKLLGAAMRISPSSTRTGFSEEVQGDSPRHWAFDQGYIQGAVGAGLLVPSDYGAQLAPDTPIKRREILLAAVRALGQEPIVYQQGRKLTTPDAGNYPDWLQAYAALALSDKILTGYTDGTVGLDRTATRAESLAIVQRILSRVTLSLAQADGPAGTQVARHPGEGEVTWSWTSTSGRPSVLAGTLNYTFPFDVTDLALLPAPGNVAWVRYKSGETGVISRIYQGTLTEVARYDGGKTPDLLAVGDDGKLWFTDGDGQLLTADRIGQVNPIAGVTERLRFGEIDWGGNFWGLGASKVYKVTADGNVITQDAGLTPDVPVVAFAMADDSTAWVLTGGAPGGESKLEAVSVAGGTAKKETLLTSYFGGLGASASAVPVGRNGPFLWLTGHVDGSDRQEGLFRFDLTTGEFVRQVMPRSRPADMTAQANPGGGVLLQESGGAFWRIVE